MCFYTGQFVGLANNTENVIGSISSLETQMIWEATILAKTVPPPNAVTPCLNIYTYQNGDLLSDQSRLGFRVGH